MNVCGSTCKKEDIIIRRHITSIHILASKQKHSEIEISCIFPCIFTAHNIGLEYTYRPTHLKIYFAIKNKKSDIGKHYMSHFGEQPLT